MSSPVSYLSASFSWISAERQKELVIQYFTSIWHKSLQTNNELGGIVYSVSWDYDRFCILVEGEDKIRIHLGNRSIGSPNFTLPILIPFEGSCWIVRAFYLGEQCDGRIVQIDFEWVWCPSVSEFESHDVLINRLVVRFAGHPNFIKHRIPNVLVLSIRSRHDASIQTHHTQKQQRKKTTHKSFHNSSISSVVKNKNYLSFNKYLVLFISAITSSRMLRRSVSFSSNPSVTSSVKYAMVVSKNSLANSSE